MTPHSPLAPIGNQTVASEMPNAHNYHRWMLDHVREYVHGRVLDVGGGTGSHLDLLLEIVDCIGVVDISPDSVAELRKREPVRSGNVTVAVADICDPGLAAMEIARDIDTITCFDVLEHIEDDLLALGHLRTLLEPRGGKLLLKVPAHPFLYGALDHLAGHFRRYTKATLTAQLAKSGFTVVDCFHVNAIGAAGWFVTSRILRPKELSAPSVNFQVRMFDRTVVPIQAKLESFWRPPFGQSLFAVAQAPHR